MIFKDKQNFVAKGSLPGPIGGSLKYRIYNKYYCIVYVRIKVLFLFPAFLSFVWVFLQH